MSAPARSTKTTPLEGETTFYRALAPCRVGSYREPGEEFCWANFTPCPPYLEEVGAPSKAAPDSSVKGTTAAKRPPMRAGIAATLPGVTTAEIFAAAQ